MLDEQIKVVIGMPLKHLPTGETFKVLCSCPSSRPLHHTRRYVENNRQEYSLPEVTHGDT